MKRKLPRLGLCCTFRDQSIKFRTTTAAAMSRVPRAEALEKLSALCLDNAGTLLAALEYCATSGIGCFRIVSQILPLKTHPELGYEIDELPDGAQIVARLQQCGQFARQSGVRTSFHPDQFVVLNSRRPEVVAASLREIEYQNQVAEWVNADVINIHAGGAWGDKRQALADFQRGFAQLSPSAQSRLTLENDDKLFTPADLLPLCRRAGIPLVYDVHHHRCHRDELSVEAATEAAMGTWNREPLFHLSSPQSGWGGAYPERHHDFIDPADFPACWLNRQLTVEVEAKAKELALLRLIRDLQRPLKKRSRGGARAL
jgi:UV DNA damage endonuclease